MKIYGKRFHLGKKVKKTLGIKHGWFGRFFGIKRPKTYQVSSASSASDRRLSNIA